MTVSAYIGEKFTTTHENQAFNELYRRLLSEWQESDEEIVLLGNFFCEGNELDCAVLKKDSITVIDFKNYGGKLSVTENGPWKADGAVVKGGSNSNSRNKCDTDCVIYFERSNLEPSQATLPTKSTS